MSTVTPPALKWLLWASSPPEQAVNYCSPVHCCLLIAMHYFFFPNSTASIHLGICGKLDWGQILVPLLLAEWPSTNLLLGAGLVEVCGNCTHGFKGNSQLSLFYCSGKFKKGDIKPEVFGSWRGCSLNFLFTAKVHNQFHEKHLKKENLNISILLLLNHCIFIFSFYPF